eukprot:9194769-Pyramimonas_sp.AAC.1
MAVADTFWTSGATFFQGMHRSKIDHAIMPQSAVPRITILSALQGLGRRAHLVHFAPLVNRDAMLAAYTRGHRGQGLLEKIEGRARQITQDDWRQIWGRGDAQA